MSRHMGRSQEEHRRALGEKLARVGGDPRNLPRAPEGAVMQHFEPRQFARLLKQEVALAKTNGWPQVTLHMDTENALALAAALEVR